MSKQQELDVLIVGGGLVGCSLAIALSGSGRRLGLVEAQSGDLHPPPSFDERNLALARASLNALTALGVLQRLSRAPAPIERIHISRQGDFGAVRLAAADHQVETLGGVVMARDLGLALQQACADLPIERIAPATLIAAQRAADGWTVKLSTPRGERQLHTRLLVGADGSNSAVRAALAVPVTTHDYQQDLLVCSLQAGQKPAGQAWERFTDNGPVALLPRNDGRFGAVCAVPRDQSAAVLAMDDSAYLDYLQQRFGWRAGRFLAVGKRVAYPLGSLTAARLIGERAVLVGNAAQTLHPVGAQGFNLGLRDALTLAECLSGADDPGSEALLVDYSARRQADREQTLSFSDGLARLTAQSGSLAHLGRSLGLLALERSVSLKARVAAGAMGFRGQVPALARAGQGAGQ